MKKISLMLCAICLLSVSSLLADAKKDMIGYWKADVDQLSKTLDKKLGEMPEAQRKMAVAMKSMMLEMFKHFAFHITEKEQIAITPKGEEKRSYEVVKVDGNKVTMKTDGKETTILVEKDKLSINENKMELTMTRIDKAEFEKRKKGMAEFAEKMKQKMGGAMPPQGK